MAIIHRGNWFYIEEKNGRYWMSFDSGALINPERCCEISKEHALKAMQSDKDAGDVSYYALIGHWPLTKEEQLKNDRNLIRKFPELLLKFPKNYELFDAEELETLLRKAKDKQRGL